MNNDLDLFKEKVFELNIKVEKMSKTIERQKQIIKEDKKYIKALQKRNCNNCKYIDDLLKLMNKQ